MIILRYGFSKKKMAAYYGKVLVISSPVTSINNMGFLSKRHAFVIWKLKKMFKFKCNYGGPQTKRFPIHEILTLHPLN